MRGIATALSLVFVLCSAAVERTRTPRDIGGGGADLAISLQELVEPRLDPPIGFPSQAEEYLLHAYYAEGDRRDGPGPRHDSAIRICTGQLAEDVGISEGTSLKVSVKGLRRSDRHPILNT